METKELLDNFYKILLSKGDLDPFLSKTFLLVGALAKETHGKDAFTNTLFFSLVKKLAVKSLIIDGEKACVLVTYELLSPKGDKLLCDVAEIWESKGGKLASLEIYFDTLAYQKFIIPILFPLTKLKKKRLS